jgi:hypothetical protein
MNPLVPWAILAISWCAVIFTFAWGLCKTRANAERQHERALRRRNGSSASVTRSWWESDRQIQNALDAANRPRKAG